ncbi:MAG: hypothetical protein AAF737_04660, partial [Pseudomonadota bacterium]
MSNDPRAAAPQPNVEAEDPLVELARIVSGGNQFEPAAPAYAEDQAGDLEAELLAELEGTQPFEAAYGEDDFAAVYPDLAAAEGAAMDQQAAAFAQPDMAAMPEPAELDAASIEADLSAGFAQEFDAEFDAGFDAQLDAAAVEAELPQSDMPAPAE